jgi:hypothetical protein
VRASGVDFFRLIAGDYAALTIGSQRIDEAVPAVEKATMDAALKYIGRPGGEGIYRMIVELVEVAAAIHAIVDASDAFFELPLLLEVAADSRQQLLTFFMGKMSSAVL